MKAPAIIIIVILTVVCVGLVAAIISTISHNRELAAQLEQAGIKTGSATESADAGQLRRLLEQEEAANATLRNELAKLQRAATNSAAAASPVTVADDTQRRPDSRRPPGSAWLDRIRQEAPARYKQIVEQREQRRKAVDQWYQDTIDQLDQRAASAPTQQEAELATQIADTLAKLNDLRQQWEALRNLPDDQRQAQIPELAAQTRQLESQLRDLSQQDRTLQLQKYAQSLGVTDQSGLQDFVNSVSTIYSNTSYRAIRGGGGPGGPPPPPPQQSPSPR